MNKAEVARRLRDLESEISCFREDLEHEHSWDIAKEHIDTPRPNDEPCLTLRDVDPEAAFVEQIEIFIHDAKPEYHVRFRYDDDTTEKLGIFSLYSTAYEYAREQARRYHIPIFDSTYEDLVD